MPINLTNTENLGDHTITIDVIGNQEYWVHPDRIVDISDKCPNVGQTVDGAQQVIARYGRSELTGKIVELLFAHQVGEYAFGPIFRLDGAPDDLVLDDRFVRRANQAGVDATQFADLIVAQSQDDSLNV